MNAKQLIDILERAESETEIKIKPYSYSSSTNDLWKVCLDFEGDEKTIILIPQE